MYIANVVTTVTHYTVYTNLQQNMHWVHIGTSL